MKIHAENVREVAIPKDFGLLEAVQASGLSRFSLLRRDIFVRLSKVYEPKLLARRRRVVVSRFNFG
jgi:hypothetical protein